MIKDRIKTYLKKRFPELPLGWEATKAYQRALRLLFISTPESTREILSEITLIESIIAELNSLGAKQTQITLQSQIGSLVCNLENRLPDNELIQLLEEKTKTLTRMLGDNPSLKSDDFGVWLAASAARLNSLVMIQTKHAKINGHDPKHAIKFSKSIKACETLYDQAESNFKINSALERTLARITIVNAIITACSHLIYYPGVGSKEPYAQKLLFYAEKLSKLKFVKLSKIDAIQAKMALAVAYFESARINESADSAKNVIDLAGEISGFFPPHISNSLHVKAQELKLRASILLSYFSPDDMALKENNFSSARELLDYEILPIRSKLSIIAEVVKYAIDIKHDLLVDDTANRLKSLRCSCLESTALREEFVRA